MARSKYGNKPQTVGGETYRSKRELARHQELILMQRAGLIAGLVREVPFELAPAVVIAGRKRPPLRYYADFVYSTSDGAQVIEDVKSVATRTAAYKVKRHILLALHGIEITEVS